MDIDEFLDRELSDIGLPTAKTEKSEAIEMQEFKQEFDDSSLFDTIKVNLSKGNLEIAEQAYVSLWHILMQQKLNWNKELYEQLSIINKQFSSVLSIAHNEVKKKADHIYGLVNKAKAELREGKKELPFKLYSEIEQINNSIPNVFFEEKKVILDQITDFYKELRNTTDIGLINRVSALIQEVNQLLNKINLAINSNDMINAIVNYNKCIELYNQIPEGFLMYKNLAGARLLEVYKSLSIYTEISNLQKQLNQQLQSRQQIIANVKPLREFTNIITALKPINDKKILLEKKRELERELHEKKNDFLDKKRKSAKENLEKGSYDEAWNNIEEALKIEPNDVESKALRAKIKTLQ